MKGGMVGVSGSPEQNCGSQSWETQEGFQEGWGPGACGVKRSGVLEDEARKELQEESQAGTTRRGRNFWSNHGLENETREELQEELRSVLGVEK